MNRLKSIKMKAGQKSSDIRLPKPPKPPEKPLMPYMRYSRKVWESVKNANPLLKLWEVGKIIGQMWRELPENEKSHFVEEYENDKLQYNDALRMYHNSPAYKSWLLHKEKVERTLDDSDSMDGSMSQSQFFKQKDRLGKDPHGVETRESYILEDNDEDPDEVFTVKHVAAQRFQRNHKFMLDLFSDFKIPELGVIVTESRLNSLKQQVNSLFMHKRKLDEEIEEWEKKHDNKKIKIKVESEEFWSDYNKELEARPVITENMFSEMVKRARDDIIREEKERDEFIKNRLSANERKTSISDQSTESSSKSESNTSIDQHITPQSHFEPPTLNQSNDSSIPNPFTASVVNKPHMTESQGQLGPPDLHQHMLGPPFMQMSQRGHLNPFDNRSQTSNYGYTQQPTPPPSATSQPHQQQQQPHPAANYPGRYPGPPTLTQQINNPHMCPHPPPPSLSARSHMMSPAAVDIGPPADMEQKPPKSNRPREVLSPCIEKETHFESRSKPSKEKSESFSVHKMSDSQNYALNMPLNSKAPILSPKNEPNDPGEPPISVQSSKKPSSKKRRPPANKGNSKASSGGSGLDLDVPGGPEVLPQSKMEAGGYPQMDAGLLPPSQPPMPQQQQGGMYPYHYYQQQFVPHGGGRTPGQYGMPYQQQPQPQQGFGQAGYYGQMPPQQQQAPPQHPQAQYRQMAPHQMQQQAGGDLPGGQYTAAALQHKAAPSAGSYGPPGMYAGGYGGPQYAGGSFPLPGAPQMQEMAGGQPKEAPLAQASHLGLQEDPVKYQGEVAGYGGPQTHPTPGGYPSSTASYPGLPYTGQAGGGHYQGGHYLAYYPPGTSGPPSGQQGTEHPFWPSQHHSQGQGGVPPGQTDLGGQPEASKD